MVISFSAQGIDCFSIRDASAQLLAPGNQRLTQSIVIDAELVAELEAIVVRAREKM